MRHVLAGFAGLASALLGFAAAAQQVGDPAAGRRLAEAWCSQCHAIGPGASGPESGAAPGFPAVAEMPSTTAMSLHAFLRTPHARMPDIQMTPHQLDDLIAYILSLQNR